MSMTDDLLISIFNVLFSVFKGKWPLRGKWYCWTFLLSWLCFLSCLSWNCPLLVISSHVGLPLWLFFVTGLLLLPTPSAVHLCSRLQPPPTYWWLPYICISSPESLLTPRFIYSNDWTPIPGWKQIPHLFPKLCSSHVWWRLLTRLATKVTSLSKLKHQNENKNSYSLSPLSHSQHPITHQFLILFPNHFLYLLFLFTYTAPVLGQTLITFPLNHGNSLINHPLTHFLVSQSAYVSSLFKTLQMFMLPKWKCIQKFLVRELNKQRSSWVCPSPRSGRKGAEKSSKMLSWWEWRAVEGRRASGEMELFMRA